MIIGQSHFTQHLDRYSVYHVDQHILLAIPKQQPAMLEQCHKMSLQQAVDSHKYKIVEYDLLISSLRLQPNGDPSLQTIKKILNSRHPWVSPRRNFLSNIIFRILVILCGCVCLLQHYICNIILTVMTPINQLCSLIRIVPFSWLQYQIARKTNVIYRMQQTHISQYLLIVESLTHIILDMSIGLLSLVYSHAFLSTFMAVFQHLNIRVQFNFFNQHMKLFSIYRNPLIFEFQQQVLVWLYRCMGYLGISCQIMLTASLGYIGTLNYLIAYKLLGYLYHLCLLLCRYALTVIKATNKNNLTKVIPPYMLSPPVKIFFIFILVMVVAHLPTIILNYLWFLNCIFVFRVMSNTMLYVVRLFYALPLATIMETIKKPYIHPAIMEITIENEKMHLIGQRVNRLSIVFSLLYSNYGTQIESIVSVDPNIGLSTIIKMLKGVDLDVQPEIEQIEGWLNPLKFITHLMLL